jgi:uncharacterized protein
MFGLTESDLNIIINILSEYPDIEQAIIFGSRVMGKQKDGSDVDIALKGNIQEKTANEVSGRLNDESPLPYFFDVIAFNFISNQDLEEHIEKVGQIIYSKGKKRSFT